MLVGENPLDLTRKIYEATRVTATMRKWRISAIGMSRPCGSR